MQPQVIETRFPTDDVVIASLVVEPPADGDASGIIQAALDEAAAAGGAVVFLRAGRYRLEGPLTVREGVTLRGDWAPPGKAAADQTTLLMPVAGRGEADGTPALLLERGSGLREVTIWYPDQKPGDIVPYPWTIKTSTTVGGDNYTVLNCTLVNPYQGLKVGPESNELHTVRNVYGTPLKTGIWLDSTTDIGRVIDLHFGPKWWEESGLPGAPSTPSAQQSLRRFLLDEGTGIDMGRSDWEYLWSLEVQGYGTGMTLRKGERGVANAVLFGSRFLGCRTAIRLVELNAVGLAATGCTFGATEFAIHAPASFRTVAQFNTCTFTAEPRAAVKLEGQGTLTFQHCRFDGWQDAAVDAQSGTVSLHGCDFRAGGVPCRFGEGVRRVRMLGNRLPDGAKVEVQCPQADVMIHHGQSAPAMPDVSLPPPAPVRRPATRKLFLVTDFGAAATAADNTAAFRRALGAARQAGGGTVYVPAGNYRFAGELTVPTGVELRGLFDVPHHTVSAGSVLMPTGGEGQEEGTPFLQLESGAGLRGLTLWYPEQNLLDIAPYPWTVRGLGAGCWLIDVCLGNAYQGVDFWTHPSDGHVVSYLAGGVLRRGLFVSKCAGDGWVEDVQFNPHYTGRLHRSLPHPTYPGATGGRVIDYQRHYLEGLVFGRCEREHLNRNFLYAAHDGLAFRDDGGGANARVINHGTDTGSRAAVLEASGQRGVEFINAQLVPLGKYEVAALVAPPNAKGSFRFFNSQVWGGKHTGLIQGDADILVQQMNTRCGTFTLRGGRSTLEQIHFIREVEPHLAVEPPCASARLVGNLSAAGLLRLKNDLGDRCQALANSVSFRPAAKGDSFATGWEEGQPQGATHKVATRGGGLNSVSGQSCSAVDTKGHRSKRALRVAGNADDPAHSYVYFAVFQGKWRVAADSVLSYWIRPTNQRGRNVGLDLRFTDGSTLRDSGGRTADGQGLHPGTSRGVVGQWKRIVIRLGGFAAGKTIDTFMFAFDGRGGAGPFETFIDDLKLESALSEAVWEVDIQPEGGSIAPGTPVTLIAPEEAPIRYTLDGTNPTPASPLYKAPLRFTQPGPVEVRYAAEAAPGQLSPLVFGKLFVVR